MADKRQTSTFEGECQESSFLGGLWDTVRGLNPFLTEDELAEVARSASANAGSGCTGTIKDSAGSFGDVQKNMRDAQNVTPEEAQGAIKMLQDKLNSATEAADSSLVGKAQSSIDDAQDAVNQAFSAILFNDSAWREYLSAASAKVTIALNQLSAGALQLKFRDEMLKEDIKKPLENLGIDLVWIAVAAGVIVGGYFVARAVYR
jgi:uncharacterized protein YjbJ (UPF0337 family)